MKALLKYPGSKWKIADWIIRHFPNHKVYLEPFFGSGACFFNKAPVYIETINDLNGDIVNLFKVCREHPDELSRQLMLTPYSREEFVSCYEKAVEPIERARRTLVRYHQSFGTSNSYKTSWRNVQMYGGPRTATMWNHLPEIVQDVALRLKDAQIENTDALELIKRYSHSETLIYIDPPYISELRKKDMYKFEMNDEQHKELLNIIKDSKSMVILSGYDNELYNKELDGWFTDTITAQAQFGKARQEKIWMNFPYQYSLF